MNADRIAQRLIVCQCLVLCAVLLLIYTLPSGICMRVVATFLTNDVPFMLSAPMSHKRAVQHSHCGDAVEARTHCYVVDI